MVLVAVGVSFMLLCTAVLESTLSRYPNHVRWNRYFKSYPLGQIFHVVPVGTDTLLQVVPVGTDSPNIPEDSDYISPENRLYSWDNTCKVGEDVKDCKN